MFTTTPVSSALALLQSFDVLHGLVIEVISYGAHLIKKPCPESQWMRK